MSSHVQKWLELKGRVADIRKRNNVLHQKVLVRDVDIKNKTLFLTTNDGKEITFLLAGDMAIKLYSPETRFQEEVMI